MNDPLKAGIKTSEGIFTAVSLLVSAVVSVLVILGVVSADEQIYLAELATKAIVAVFTLIVSGVALRQFIIGRTQLKSQQMELMIEKKEVTG